MTNSTWRVTVPPTIEPVTLSEAKAQCRIDGEVDDALLNGKIQAAREYCEGLDWRAYLTQTIELWLTAWPSAIVLPRPPLQSVTSIKYYDVADVEATFAASNYFVDTVSAPGRVVLKDGKTWPSTVLRTYNAICVTYVAGWTAAARVPQTIKDAMLLLIGHWYENREATISGTIARPIELGVRSLLDVQRVFEY